MNKLSSAILNASVYLQVKGQEKFKSLMTDERGVTAIEYSMIAVAVSAMLFIVLGDGTQGDNFLGKIIQAFSAIKNNLDSSIGALTPTP